MSIFPYQNRGRFLSRILALFLIFTFVLNDIPLFRFASARADSKMPVPAFSPIPPAVSLLDKMRDIKILKARIERMHAGSNQSSLMVLIRDLHCHEEAQTGIAHVIRQMRDELQLKDVLLEGAEGPFQMDLILAFPIEEVRKRVALEFLKEGYLTGAEFEAVRKGLDDKMELYGVEELDLYVENLRAFRSVKKLLYGLEEDFKNMDREIQQMIEAGFSQDLKLLWDLSAVLKKSEGLKIEEVLNRLEEFLKKRGKAFDGRLAQFQNLLRETQELKEERVSEEHAKLLELFQKRGVHADLKALVKMQLEYRLGRIETTAYAEFLKERYEKEDSHFDQDFPNLAQSLLMKARFESLDVAALWEELEARLEEWMEEEAQREGKKEILEKAQRWELLKKLVNLELTREELKKIRVQGPGSRVQGREAGFAELIQSAQKFYELALKRDEVMAHQGLKRLAQRGSKGGILVTGGFHTSGIEKILEKEGWSYVTLVPEVHQRQDSALYERLMMDKSLEHVEPRLSESAAPLITARGGTPPRRNIGAWVDFDQRRVAFRFGEDESRWGLQVPTFFAMLEMTAKGAYDERLERLWEKVLGQGEVRARRINELVNEWMQKGGSIQFLGSLEPKEIGRIILVIGRFYPEEVLGELAKLNLDDPDQTAIAFQGFKRAFEKSYPGLVAMLEIYFKKKGEAAGRAKEARRAEQEVSEIAKQGHSMVFADNPDAVDQWFRADAAKTGKPYVRVNLRDLDELNSLITEVVVDEETGTYEVHPGPLIQAIRQGGIVLLDYNDAQPQAALRFNSLFEAKPYFTSRWGRDEASQDLVMVGTMDPDKMVRIGFEEMPQLRMFDASIYSRFQT